MTFQNNIPQNGDLLSNSQGDLLVNFQQLNTKFGVDHVTFNPAVTNSGKHNKVTLPQQGSDPATGSLEGAIYTKDISGATLPVYRAPSSGAITQLIPASTWDSGNSRGTVLLGNIRINFGTVTVGEGAGQGSGIATFHTAFSAAPYSCDAIALNATDDADPDKGNGGAAGANVWIPTRSSTSMTIFQQGINRIKQRYFSYIAIGPA